MKYNPFSCDAWFSKGEEDDDDSRDGALEQEKQQQQILLQVRPSLCNVLSKSR